MSRAESLLRVLVGLIYMASAFVVHLWVLLVLLPFRGLRIRSCNVYGWITGRVIRWLSGSPMTVEGREHLDAGRQAIYISNHASMLDIFIGIQLGPMGTCGVAKKEVVWTPFFGQLYWLSGHLRIDRGNRDKAIAAMKRLADQVARYGLSIWMFPEGTRSRDGRLLPFKKGVYHLALSTGLPVVPVVVQGTHQAWQKGTLALSGAPLHVKVLPPIDTSQWHERSSDEVLQELHGLYVEHLPEDQRPRSPTEEAHAPGDHAQ